PNSWRRLSSAGVVVQTRGTGPLGGQFDHQVEGGGRNLCQFSQVERDTEQGVDLHRSTSLKVLHDALEMARCSQSAQYFVWIAWIATQGAGDGGALGGHRSRGAGTGGLVENILHGRGAEYAQRAPDEIHGQFGPDR